MTDQYHINVHGEPAKCDATSEESCPRAKEGSPHGATPDEVQRKQESLRNDEMHTTLSKNSIMKPKPVTLAEPYLTTKDRNLRMKLQKELLYKATNARDERHVKVGEFMNNEFARPGELYSREGRLYQVTKIRHDSPEEGTYVRLQEVFKNEGIGRPLETNNSDELAKIKRESNDAKSENPMPVYDAKAVEAAQNSLDAQMELKTKISNALADRTSAQNSFPLRRKQRIAKANENITNIMEEMTRSGEEHRRKFGDVEYFAKKEGKPIRPSRAANLKAFKNTR